MSSRAHRTRIQTTTEESGPVHQLLNAPNTFV